MIGWVTSGGGGTPKVFLAETTEGERVFLRIGHLTIGLDRAQAAEVGGLLIAKAGEPADG